MNKSCLSIFLFSIVVTSASTAFAQQQHNYTQDMIRQIDEGAKNLQKTKSPEFNFSRPAFANPFEKLKQIEMPKFGLMDKLKGMGTPSTQTKPSRPILDGLARLFPSPQQRTSPSWWDRMTGKDQGGFPETQRLEALNELNGIARGIGERTGQAAQSAQQGLNRFSNSVIPGPQPPLRSARESYGSSSRY